MAGGPSKSYHYEVRDTIVKVTVNEKPVVNNDLKATTPNDVFVPNRIELFIELEK